MVPPIPVSDGMTVPTYTPISRHSNKCPFSKSASKGRADTKCGCRKLVAVYDPSGVLQRRSKSGRILTQFNLKARTRDWEEAERIAQAYRDRHNPDKARAAEAEAKLKAFETVREAQIATIEKAVAKFLVFKKNNPSRRSTRRSGPTADKTMEAYYVLLGEVEPTLSTATIKREGHLFRWINKQSPRPRLISELTKDAMDDFRASWNFPSDLTSANSFTRLKTFFAYCKDMQWIGSNPLEGRTRPSVQDGSRTAAFTDDQYRAIVQTITDRATKIEKEKLPELEAQKKLADNARLLALIELGRWGAMAIEDAVEFELDTLNGDALVYRRVKNGKIAKPVLPPQVANRIRAVLPINGDPNQPFRNIKVKIGSDKAFWSRESKELFAEAGINKVKTDIRMRDPHFHMLRDTFAVGQLERNIRDGKPSLKSIADAMGDSVPVMLKHYAPIIDKLEKAHEEEQRKVVAAQVAEMQKHDDEQGEPKRVTNIAEGRK
jgi:integrase